MELELQSTIYAKGNAMLMIDELKDQNALLRAKVTRLESSKDNFRLVGNNLNSKFPISDDIKANFRFVGEQLISDLVIHSTMDYTQAVNVIGSAITSTFRIAQVQYQQYLGAFCLAKRQSLAN